MLCVATLQYSFGWHVSAPHAKGAGVEPESSGVSGEMLSGPPSSKRGEIAAPLHPARATKEAEPHRSHEA